MQDREHLAIIVALLVEGTRDRRGPDWCRKWGVGYARRRIGAPARNVVAIGSDDQVTFDAREKAAAELKAWCRECGRCKLGRE